MAVSTLAMFPNEVFSSPLACFYILILSRQNTSFPQKKFWNPLGHIEKMMCYFSGSVFFWVAHKTTNFKMFLKCFHLSPTSKIVSG